MSLASVLALCGDGCLYFATLGFVVSLCGQTRGCLPYLIIYAVCAVALLLCRRLKGFWRFAPLSLAAAFFIGAVSVTDAVLPAPLCILLALRACSRDWDAEYERTRSLFKTGLIIYACFAPVVMMFGALGSLTALSLPFFVAWTLMTVVELRLLRSADSGSPDVRLQVLNCALVLSVAGVCLALSSDAVVGFFKAVISAVYTTVISPLLLCVLMLVIAVPALLVYAFVLLMSLLRSDGGEAVELDLSGTAEGILGEVLPEAVSAPEWLGSIATALAVAAFLLVCFLILRKLIGRGGRSSSTGLFSRESAVSGALGDRRRTSLSQDSAGQIRLSYRRYLELCQKKGIRADGSLASDDVCASSEVFAGAENATALRRLWLPARYSSSPCGVEEAQEAKALLKKIKSNASGAEKLVEERTAARENQAHQA